MEEVEEAMGWFSSCGVRKGCKLNVASSPCGNVWWSSTIFGKGKKRKKDLVCQRYWKCLCLYTKRQEREKKKKRFQKYKKEITYDELMIFDCFWFFTKHAFWWKRAKKREKKSKKQKRKKEKREKRWGLYIFLSIRVSMSFDWEKTREHPNKDFFTP